VHLVDFTIQIEPTNFLFTILLYNLMMVTSEWPKRVAVIYNCYIKVVHWQIIFLSRISETRRGCHTLKFHRSVVLKAKTVLTSIQPRLFTDTSAQIPYEVTERISLTKWKVKCIYHFNLKVRRVI